jgi:hypothetical protein
MNHGKSLSAATRRSREVLLLICALLLSPPLLLADSRTPSLPSSASGFSDVTSFDVYVDARTIHFLVSGKREGEQSQGLRYLHSEDGGATWSSPVNIDTGEAPPHASSPTNAVQIAAVGEHLLAIWSTTGGGWNGYGPMRTARSADGGKTWRRGASPAGHSRPSDQSFVDLVADQNGAFHAVWLDDRAKDQRGLFAASSTDYGEHWAQHRMIDALTCDCCPNKLVTTTPGLLFVVYRDRDPRDMRCASSTNGGQTWRRGKRVGAFNWRFNGCPHVGAGAVVFNRGQTVHATIWTGRDGGRGVYYLVSHTSGQHWAAPFRLGNDTAQHSDLAALDAAHLMAVWDSLEAGHFCIMTAVSEDGGHSWSAPRLLHGSLTPVQYPRLVATPLGYRVFWIEHGTHTTWAMAAV